MQNSPEENDLGDIVDEAVGRLKVALFLLKEMAQYNTEECKGYDAQVLKEILEDVTETLHTASKLDEERNLAAAQKGGAR